MATKRVFISHAKKDKPIVDLFFDIILQNGIGLSPDEVFCSSLEGMGIPAGENFVSYIKGQIQQPEVILLMLSPHYLESIFCLCELGAGWAMSHSMIPVVIPPTQHADLKAVLTGIHVYRIDSDTDLSEFRDQFISVLGLKAAATARWDVKRGKFLEGLPVVMKMIEPPKIIAYNEYVALKNKYEESLSELRAADDEKDILLAELKAVKALKDREAVNAVEMQFSSAWDTFETLCEAVTKCADSLPAMVIEAIYHEITGKEGVPKGEHIWDEIRRAVQDGFLELSRDDEVSINTSDPKVSRYMEALDKVKRFLYSVPDDEEGGFCDQFAEEYDYQAEFGSRRLWEGHLGLSAYTKW